MNYIARFYIYHNIETSSTYTYGISLTYYSWGGWRMARWPCLPYVSGNFVLQAPKVLFAIRFLVGIK